MFIYAEAIKKLSFLYRTITIKWYEGADVTMTREWYINDEKGYA